ncbi:MAG: MBL fold metallo-hydrolase [Bacteroidia bacterium]|nr:MBL fold metallo-hydrolase [Bacteroidia bacterium]
MDTISLQFLGAASTVTGSKHLLRTPGFNVLIDCGLFQGLKELRLKNRDVFPIPPSQIDAVILTHAHLDHCGYLPVLVKNGFKGNIYLSEPTAELTEIILKDSARLQEEDAKFANEKGFSKHHPAEPLYTEEDVFPVLEKMVRGKEEEWVELSEDIKFRFIYNGHILGACFVELLCYGKLFVFSGDIGTQKSITLHPPKFPKQADYLVIESTYGDRLHPTTDTQNELAEIINDALRNNGSLLIPSFAVGRAQELMVLIKHLKSANKIPDVPVFLDTPMGVDTTKVYCKYPEWHKLNYNECAYFFDEVIRVRDIEHSYKVIDSAYPKIVIAASGMLTGGRVLHYLNSWLPKKKYTILLVGYQAEGTRGRALRGGVHELKIFGKYVPVNASVKEIHSLSAHADQRELLDWMGHLTKVPEKVFIVHGEPASARAFKLKVEDKFGYSAVVPVLNQEVALFEVS